jgi:branched-chain amino acid transport system permease protein
MVLLAVAFVLAGMAVLAVRRGPFGRRLQAMSDSPAASATLGLNLVATKATVFAASAALAGVAGALYGGLRSSVGVFDFTMLQSLFLFLAAMVGGITTVTGAAIGGAILAILPVIQQDYFQDTNLNALGVGLFAIMIARNPHGFAGFLSPAADRVRAWWRGLSTGSGAPEPAVATAAGAAPPEKVAVS